jgi:membrane associated rhomboid family serine protease
MESPFAIIPARSQQQAMDWSLVLASQSIECTIERDPDTDRWQLLVDAPDYSRALQSIRQYRIENYRPFWRQPLPWTGLIFDWRSVGWFFLIIVIFALDETHSGYLRVVGQMDSQAVWAGQWWRIFTAITLHADLAHLAANVSSGLLLLGLAMGAFGSGNALLGSYLAGAAGNLAGLTFYGNNHRGLGASGMIMGALGLLTVHSLAGWRTGGKPRHLLARALMGGVLLLVLLGTNPNSDITAHVAGFLSGCVIGSVLALLPERLAQAARFSRSAELLCGGLVLVTWWLALRAR